MSDTVRVPREPTDKIIWALCEHSDSPREACLHCPAKERTQYGEATRACRSLAEDQYRAMLSAAPQSSDAEVESLRRFVEAFKAAYPNIRQLQDGFATDIQSWSEWDESVRQQTIALGNMVFPTPAPQEPTKEFLPSPPEKDKP